MSPSVAQTCRPPHCASELQSSSTQKPPFTHTRLGGAASTCSRHCPAGPQCPQESPGDEHPGARWSVVVEVALVVVVVVGPVCPPAVTGLQSRASTAATIATSRVRCPVPSLPTCRAVDNGPSPRPV